MGVNEKKCENCKHYCSNGTCDIDGVKVKPQSTCPEFKGY
ncbi:hypothetical protein JCM19376_08390 [Fusibacter bizertensis]